MKVSVEEISSVKKKLNVEVAADDVGREIEAYYKDLGRKAKIKGFRPGKVPRNILVNYFKDAVKTEVAQKLIQDTLEKAFDEGGLKPVSAPLIDPQELEAGKAFAYAVTVEIKPEFQVEGYLGLKIEGKKEETSDAEAEERLKALQNLHAVLKTIPEARPVKEGDFVILDYEAFLEGKAVEGGKALDATMEIGAGHFVKELEEKLVGLKVEDEKEVEATFPDDYGYAKWAGKTLAFKVKIKEIKEKSLPPLDDEFAKDLGDYDSLDALKSRVKADLQKEKDHTLEHQLKDRIVDRLLETVTFEIPESLEKEQAKSLVHDTKLRLTAQGMDLKKMDLSDDKLAEDYREAARKQVKTFLILEKIADLEKVAVSGEEVEGRLREIADRTRQKFDVVKRYYEKNELLPEMEAKIRHDKTLDLLLEKASVSYVGEGTP